MDNSDKQNAVFLGQIVPFPAPIEIQGKPKTVQITYFQGTPNGIEDIDCPPDEGELPNQDWADQPTEYDQ